MYTAAVDAGDACLPGDVLEVHLDFEDSYQLRVVYRDQFGRPAIAGADSWLAFRCGLVHTLQCEHGFDADDAEATVQLLLRRLHSPDFDRPKPPRIH